MSHAQTAHPDWIVPMAAVLTDRRFSDDAWIFERKLDGIRCLAFRDAGRIRLLSRNALARNYPTVAEALAAQPSQDFVLDGEVVHDGVGIVYFVFDAPRVDGIDVTALPLVKRKILLRARFRFGDVLRYVEPLPGPGEQAYERACREGWEGVIAKRALGPYQHRRSADWLKWKCELSQELVVGGFTDPRGSRVGLGALLVGYNEGADLVYAGKVGTGFDWTTLRALRERLDPLEVPAPPFTRAVGLPRKRAHWVRPEVVVQAAFTEWTVHGKLRHPRFLGIGQDKRPREVVREA